jgi:hypothetical protein
MMHSSTKFPPRELYPEAEDEYEALALATIARAASPLAIDPVCSASSLATASIADQ